MTIIISNGRVLIEHLVTFMPNPNEEDTSFVVYNKEGDSFFSYNRKWLEAFETSCIFEYEMNNVGFASDLLILTEVFNHLYKINQLEILSLFEYTKALDKIEFDHPLFDGQRDYLRIFEMIKSANE